VEFVTGSIGSPGVFEAAEYSLPSSHPLRPAYIHQSSAAAPVQPALNVTLVHGVASAFVLQASGDRAAALAARDPAVAPHLAFADTAGHGYATVRAGPEALEVEFVGLPRPVEATGRPDGDHVVYRVTHRTPTWRPGEPPLVERVKLEGEPPLVL
jgi:alkaline phosphatase D